MPRISQDRLIYLERLEALDASPSEIKELRRIAARSGYKREEVFFDIYTYSAARDQHVARVRQEEREQAEARIARATESLRDENTDLAAKVAKLERFIDDVAVIDDTFKQRFTDPNPALHPFLAVEEAVSIPERVLCFDDAHIAAEQVRRDLEAEHARTLAGSFRGAPKPASTTKKPAAKRKATK